MWPDLNPWPTISRLDNTSLSLLYFTNIVVAHRTSTFWYRHHHLFTFLLCSPFLLGPEIEKEATDGNLRKTFRAVWVRWREWDTRWDCGYCSIFPRQHLLDLSESNKQAKKNLIVTSLFMAFLIKEAGLSPRWIPRAATLRTIDYLFVCLPIASSLDMTQLP
jgi:hypothetical protein